MWKKSDNQYPEPIAVSPMPNDLAIGPRDQAVIGPSITIKGDLAGEEDLVVQGRVEGTIHLNQYHVTIGKNGRVRADVYAKSIKVEGEVQGNLFGQEHVSVRKTGHVQGNIVAPNVSLEEGCRFRGSVDMDSQQAAKETKSEPTLKAPAPPVAQTANGVKDKPKTLV